MSEHELWPDYSETDCPYTARTCKGMVITEGQYNYAKVRIDACAGMIDPQLTIKTLLENLVEADENIEELEAERDALQQRCEELVSALVELENRYCDAGQYLTPDERLAHRKTLIKVRQLIANQVQP